MDRRKFLNMFALGSVGMTVADKIGFFQELKNWVLSPSKTIFIPPETKVVTEFLYQPWALSGVIVDGWQWDREKYAKKIMERFPQGSGKQKFTVWGE